MSKLATTTPLRLQISGAALAANVLLTLESSRIQQRLSAPALCELTFAAPGRMRELEAVHVGDPLTLQPAPGSQRGFSGEITAIEYGYSAGLGNTLRIRAYDKLYRLRKRQTVRMHVQVTPAGLMRELTADLGVTVKAAVEGPSLPNLMQHAQSDLRLLQEVTARYGLYFFLQDDVVRLTTLAGSGESIPLELGSSLLEGNFSMNLDPACRTVTAIGWDAQRVELHQAKADRPSRREALDTGAAGAGPFLGRTVHDACALSDTDAESMAQALLDLRSAREVVLSGVAEGDWSLQPGALVEVSGVAQAVSGEYVLTACNHWMDAARGYQTEITTEPAELATSSQPGSMATWGTVTRVDDPEALGRVKVSLPTINNVETDWLGVVCPGAGSGKGLVALPGPGDHVLVLFIDRDQSQALVLGGLFGAGGPPDSGVENGAVKRYSVTSAGGQLLRFDDAGSLLRLENKAGSFIELGPEKTRLHSATDLEIDVPGRAILIRGKSVDFVEG
jgi:phage protein D/phage baseplate assembly protein gpV